MNKIPSRRRTPLFEVRHSSIHGYGVFAARRIRKGTKVVEYLGERVSHAEADARYEGKDPRDNHTFLFTVDENTVIDAGAHGNEARYINHGCDPNCESVISGKRVFIMAIRTIQSGEELAYDYQIQRDSDDAPDIDDIYACRCGAMNCRGSMLETPKRPSKKAHTLARRAPQRAAGKNGRKRLARRGGMAARPRRRGG
jgi:SET domain-containing protein